MKKILFLIYALQFTSQTYADICAGYAQHCVYDNENRYLVIQNLKGKAQTLSTILRRVTDPTTVTVLSLDDNELQTLPPEIGNLVALTSLSLDDNELQTLPPEIGNLVALTSLNLADNELRTLPPEIGNLVALTELDLSENRLVALPAEIGNLLALEGLYLVENRLEALPAEIENLVALIRLDLRKNRLEALNLANSMINRSHELAFVTPRTPENLAAVATAQELFFEAEEVTQADREARDVAVFENLDTSVFERLIATNAALDRFNAKWKELGAQGFDFLQKNDDARREFTTIFPSWAEYCERQQNE
jgi:hypothetical protein